MDPTQGGMEGGRANRVRVRDMRQKGKPKA